MLPTTFAKASAFAQGYGGQDGGQDVEVLPIPIPIANERKIGDEKNDEGAAFPQRN